MLESLFGNRVVERILLYLLVYETGHIRGMANIFSIPVNGVTQQLRRLEDGGVIASQLQGKIRLYRFNPRYPFLDELKNLLQKCLDALPQDEVDAYYRMRTRPRRKGKP